MNSTDLRFPGTVGLLVAVLFLATELILLPLFEQARERLTTAYLRKRVARGDKVWLHCESKVAQWFGMSDGVGITGGALLLLRFLKMLFKFSLLAFCFLFELSIASVTVATDVSYSFNGGGASVVAPVPVPGLLPTDLNGLVPFGGIQTKANRSYSVSRKQGLDLEFSSMCTITKRNLNSTERFVYFGIYTEHDSKLVCLNGTEGRQKRTILSYNPNSTQTAHSNITSIELLRNLATDGLSYLFDVVVKLEGSLDLHRGFVAVTAKTHYIKDVEWSMYGLLLHSKRRTVMRLNIPISMYEIPCYKDIEMLPEYPGNWLGLWKRNGTDIICPDRTTKHDMARILNMFPSDAEGNIADIADVNLKLGEADEFEFGKPLDVLRAWMAETIFYAFKAPIQFTYELNDKISSDVFYFSDAKKNTLVFQTGAPVSRATVKKLPTIALVVSVVALLLYCMASFIVELRSRTRTGISSNILSREACLQMLHDETSVRGQPRANRRTPLPVVLMSGLYGKRLAVDRLDNLKTLSSEFPS